MTDTQAEITTLIYALGDAIERKDWPTAGLMQERLLALYWPLAEGHPHVDTVLDHNATLTKLAERQSTKIH